MHITIAIDAFKGSLTSPEAGTAAAEGIRRVYPDAKITVKPIADGGEGTVEALTAGLGGTLRRITVTGPLGEPVTAAYGIVDLEKTWGTEETAEEAAGKTEEKTAAGQDKLAVLEMAQAAGLTLVPEKKRNPLNTTTYGVGELIRDAIAQGCRRFLVGIGGSATNDGGIGMLQALGYDLLNQAGQPAAFGAKGLSELAAVGTAHVIPELKECTFRIACDVTNPLCGSQGCSAVFAPQKGADAQMAADMDRWMEHYAKLMESFLRSNGLARADGVLSRCPGAGAAGGLGFAFLAFTNASLESGIQIVLEESGLEQAVRQSDIVITGEGRLDAQTAMGKAPAGVAALAKKYGKPVIGFAGCVAEDAGACHQAGIDACFPILRQTVSEADAMNPERAKVNLANTAEQVFRLIRTWNEHKMDL